MNNDPRGSVWRQWDLHFHTPASYDYQDKSVRSEQIVDELVGNDVAAVVVSDHHRIDPTWIEGLRSAAEHRLTVFPGIELRSELGGSASVHYIGIFPEDANVEHIWTKLQGQLGLTPTDIQSKGGDNSIYVPFESGARCIRSLGGLVSVHAGSKSNSIEAITNAQKFKQAIKADLLRSMIDILEVGSVADIKAYKEIVFPVVGRQVPLVIASDNHRITDYSRKALCWLKADPTFCGLRHVLQEPEERVYIGEVPPLTERVRKNRTKYIRSMSVRKRDGAVLAEHWFNSTIPLNHGLVAIIGNKGSGKSALADIMGLMGDSLNGTSFSFLHAQRFCKPSDNKAQHFEAMITWESGGTATRTLCESVDSGTIESVRYLPQSHIEAICNELSGQQDSGFASELRSVIFSHVEEADRLGQTSLDGLIAYKTQQTIDAISLLTGELKTAVKAVVQLEVQQTANHRRSLEQQLAAKERELKTHDAVKPTEVAKPGECAASGHTSVQVEQRIDECRKELGELEGETRQLASEQTLHAKRIAAADRLQGRIRNLQAEIRKFRKEMSADCSELGLDSAGILQVSFDSTSVEKQRVLSEGRLRQLVKRLDAENPESPVAKAESVRRKMEELKESLDRPNRIYQQYLKELAEWKQRREAILGHEDTPDTLHYWKSRVADLAEVPGRLEQAWRQVIEKSMEVYGRIQELAAEYRKLYNPVQRFIQNHEIASKDLGIAFEAAVVESGFVEGFLRHVHQGRRGSFCGASEGREKLAEICKQADFGSEEGVRRFFGEVLHCLRNDTRGGECNPVQIAEQIASGSSPEALYEHLLGLSYLRPSYTLRWADKSVDQLSPGERGTLLLVFYLLIDRWDVPLIIDQPEENLDNQTVYDVLVPSIKKAKNRRQIILVTHNPNLAVVCDADQVIHASLDKEDGNRVSYVSGAIENPIINKLLVDILEGTRPAFDNRGAKYVTSSGRR